MSQIDSALCESDTIGDRATDVSVCIYAQARVAAPVLHWSPSLNLHLLCDICSITWLVNLVARKRGSAVCKGGHSQPEE